MKLFDMVLCDRCVRPGVIDGLHHLGITRHLLLIARRELADFKIGQQMFDLAICQLAPLETGGGANTFDGCDMAEGAEPFRRQVSERAPPPPLNSSTSDKRDGSSLVALMVWILSMPEYVPD